MNIGLFFPKVFTLARNTFNASGVNVNNFYGDRLSLKVCILFLIIFIILAALVPKGVPQFAAMVFGVFLFVVITVFSDVKVEHNSMATADVNNGFSVAQTSFQVRPNKIASGKNLYDYLSEKPTTKSSTTNDYQIYAKVYHGKSYQTYLFGNIKNGRFTANIRNTHKTKVATTGMLTALDSYATYIKKHHLESDFKDSAKLELSDKYLDQDYRPMLIMKGKDGQILRVKEQTPATAKNVILTK